MIHPLFKPHNHPLSTPSYFCCNPDPLSQGAIKGENHDQHCQRPSQVRQNWLQESRDPWAHIFLNILQYIIITIMHFAIRQTAPTPKLSGYARSNPLKQPHSGTQESLTLNENIQTDREQLFNLTVTDRRDATEPEQRIIKRSMINRSCINTLSFCNRSLEVVPGDLTRKGAVRFQHIQRLDLSFNRITDIHSIKFQRFTSLKQLILNDNSISELPFSQINLCKGLKLINLNRNQLYILPTLRRVSFIEARNNPLRLVSSQLGKLPHLEFAVFDWMDYLIQTEQQTIEDKYQKHIQDFNKLKSQILLKVDYSREENINYCDFHCFFSVRLEQNSKKPIPNASFLSNLIVKSMYKSDDFFINYLRNFQNELNYANMRHNYRLLLETVFEYGDNDIIELFRLRKDNYLSVSEEVYFESLRLCCFYSHYKMFQFLFHIKAQREKVISLNRLITLVQDVLEKYDKEKESNLILQELMLVYQEYSSKAIKIALPEEYDFKIFKSMSTALLDIKTNQSLTPFFEIDIGDSQSAPLFFAMKSKNEELLVEFLKQDWNVFQRKGNGISCKFVHGSTQVSRKMVWRKEKTLIKKHWESCGRVSSSTIFRRSRTINRQTMQKQIKSEILDSQYSDIAEEFAVVKSKPKSVASPKGFIQNLQSITKNVLQDEVLPYLFIRAKQIVTLSWKKDFSKKIERIDQFIDYLQLLKQYRNYQQSPFLQRLQLWKKIIERLTYLFDTLQNETSLLQFQIVHINQLLRHLKKDNSLSMIKVESQKIGHSNGSFWCCRNVIYQ